MHAAFFFHLLFVICCLLCIYFCYTEQNVKNDCLAHHFQKHEVVDCSRYPIPCTLCGQTGIPRGEIAQHMDSTAGSCPQANVMCKFRAVGCHFQVSAKTFFQSDILCLFLLITADCFGAEHFPAPSFLFAHERLPCFGISVLIFNNKTLHLWFCWCILTISNSFPLYLVDKH